MIRKIALVALILTLACACAFAADATGKWKGSLVTPGGIKNYVYDFKVAGNVLTGTATLNGKTVQIQNGTVNGDDIAFTEPGEFNGKPVTVKYTGKVAGDKIKFQRTFADFPPDTMNVKRAQ